jgi:uncharacterized protein YegJ (DUF2314 family)
MTADQVNEIVEVMKQREHTAECIAKDNALQALTAAKVDRADHEKTAHMWLARAETWKEAWQVLVAQSNEVFMQEYDQRKRRKK